MASDFDGVLRFACVVLIVCLTGSAASAAVIERIRSKDSVIHAVLQQSIDRSPTFRELVSRIQQSDVIVHISCERLDPALRGRMTLASASSEARYLRVHVQCALPRALIAATLGHELQHVVEVASNALVTDMASFVGLFSSIGYRTCPLGAKEEFETRAAQEVGERVYREFVRWRRSDGSQLALAPARLPEP